MDSTVSGFAPRASRYFIIISMFIIQAAAQIPPGAPSITGPQVIIKDDQVTLTCTVIGGSPTPTVKWLRDDTVIDDSSTTSGNQVVNTYSFTASSREHLEVFECQSENGVLQNPLSRTKFVEVYRPPITPVLVGPTDIQPGTLTTWTCTSEGGYPLQTMAMRIGNSVFSTELTTNSALVSESYTVTGTLSWAPTTANNGQTLFCDVYHPETLGQNNPQTVSKLLTVKSPLAVNAPRTLYEPTTGQTITLTCQVTSGTATSITWYKDNQLLNLAANSRLSGASPGAPSMTISNVQTSDTGNYICSATDGSATRNTSTITVSPRATPTQPTLVGPTSMTAGSTGTWTCTSIGGFPLQTMSMRINNVVVNSNELSINSQYNSNLRTYTVVGTLNKALNMGNNGQTLFCDVTHPQTLQSPQTVSLPLTVRSPLAVNAPRTLYDPTTGQTIELTCRVTSGTATGISWYKNNQLVVLAFNNRYSGGSAQSPSLTISNVQLSDAGNYICSATDGSVTRNTSTITVSPKAPLAVNAPQNLYEPTTGQTVILQCRVTAGTATGITWYKNGQMVIKASDFRLSGAVPSSPSLTISNVRLSDTGNYICSATDGSVTRNTSTITVTAKATPSQPTLTGPTALTSGTPGTWTCTSIGAFPAQSMSMRIGNQVFSAELSVNTQFDSNARSYTAVGTLNWSPTMINNGQTIFCDVTHPDTLNGPQTVSLPLTVRSPLAVNAPTTFYNPMEDESVTLTCIVTSGTATGIKWYKNTAQINIAANPRISGSMANSPSITITDIVLADGGSYVCEATDGFATVSTNTITVTVREKPWLEYDIITYVLDGYNKLVRPVDPVNNLTHSLIPQQIFEFDGKKLVLQSQQCMNWNDPRLTWPKGQPRISLPSSEIWIPDIVLLGHKYEPDFHTKVIVMKNGDVTYCPQGPLISTDCQEKSGEVYECTFKFLSWSYDKVMLDKYFPGFASRPSIDMSIYYEHDDYEIVSRCAVRREMTYPCRDGTYPELTYSFVLRRRRSFCRNLNQSPTCN
ncbi:hemicentin-1-like isoform X16 [Mytilus californianus]|uniref:hemicentin-1-like isoform X16 n=1 Tax=Mytilus californianus TaxID=6549 RepID=UPI002245D4BB|nr:hemicentin-1-like isoform X16 [Mytilus californianus]